MYRSAIQPLCRCCGKPIPKETTVFYIGTTNGQIAGPLYSKADCQARVNSVVVSIAYNSRPGAEGRRSVFKFTTWDGESYRDPFFCAAPCAVRFAYIMARTGHCTNHYNDALAKQGETNG